MRRIFARFDAAGLGALDDSPYALQGADLLSFSVRSGGATVCGTLPGAPARVDAAVSELRRLGPSS